MLGAAHAFEMNEGGSTEKNPLSSIDRLAWLMQSTGIEFLGEAGVVATLMDSALLSKQTLSNGYQGNLPNNQWQLDVANWFSIYLASLQTHLLQTISGLPDMGPDVIVSKPTTESELDLCSSQVCFSFPTNNVL